jgi:DNA polymerase III delta subunit
MIVQLTKYFQKLWLLQEASRKPSSDFELANIIGVRSFWIGDYRAAAKNYSGRQLQECFAALVEADEKLKSSGGDQKLLMTLLVYRMLNAGQVL